jgi:hypothetical protein
MGLMENARSPAVYILQARPGLWVLVMITLWDSLEAVRAFAGEAGADLSASLAP